ncbi:MAG: diadenylate cyclase [Methanosarcinaceae archaeon]|nr:diadenylate cyclase [Methanosarcinaceae archaeon]MDD4497880.1 diadenylate cyclase [Methanosarcinaceae archaeon]
MDRARVIAENAARIAEELGASAIMVAGDLNFEGIRTEVPIFYTSIRPKSLIDHLVSVAKEGKGNVKELMGQLSQEASGNVEHLQNAAAIEYVLGEFDSGVVVGVIEAKDSSSIIVHSLAENPMIKAMKECEERVRPEVVNAVLKIAFDIAIAGREGKKVGAAFVIGDSEEVMKRSHQMILNPYAGQAEADRNILDRKNWESVKEFAQLDGIFLLDEVGMIHAAGRYLDVDAKSVDIEKGLGGRHVSAAAITRDTVAIAVTVSESGGVLRIYKDGKERICIESIIPCTRYI